MYFIGSGIVHIYLDYKKPKKKDEGEKKANEEMKIARLREGNYFGEVALITNLKRTATAKANDYTTLAYL